MRVQVENYKTKKWQYISYLGHTVLKKKSSHGLWQKYLRIFRDVWQKYTCIKIWPVCELRTSVKMQWDFLVVCMHTIFEKHITIHYFVFMWFVFAITVGVPLAMFELHTVSPVHRGFFCSDPTIRYPLKPSTFNTLLMLSLGVGVPIAVVIVFYNKGKTKLIYVIYSQTWANDHLARTTTCLKDHQITVPRDVPIFHTQDYLSNKTIFAMRIKTNFCRLWTHFTIKSDLQATTTCHGYLLKLQGTDDIDSLACDISLALNPKLLPNVWQTSGFLSAHVSLTDTYDCFHTSLTHNLDAPTCNPL